MEDLRSHAAFQLVCILVDTLTAQVTLVFSIARLLGHLERLHDAFLQDLLIQDSWSRSDIYQIPRSAEVVRNERSNFRRWYARSHDVRTLKVNHEHTLATKSVTFVTRALRVVPTIICGRGGCIEPTSRLKCQSCPQFGVVSGLTEPCIYEALLRFDRHNSGAAGYYLALTSRC